MQGTGIKTYLKKSKNRQEKGSSASKQVKMKEMQKFEGKKHKQATRNPHRKPDSIIAYIILYMTAKFRILPLKQW